MTTIVDVVNSALQAIGTRTTVTQAELTNNSSNEAIQANLVLLRLRDNLIRMAPWNCATNVNPLTYITSLPGTPENNTPGTLNWVKGQPAPPWAYEYQYPVDCMRPLWIVPQFQTGFGGGVPITTAITGGAATSLTGPPVKFKVGLDQFYSATAAAVVAGGSGYAQGDTITLAATPPGSTPIGAPAQLLVTSVGGGGVVTGVSIVNQIAGASPAQGGSYFARPTNPVGQSATSGVGTGATFNLTMVGPGDQRVILTNQEQAVATYLKQVTDPNVMDEMFIDAWSLILGSRLCIALTGDKPLANLKIQEANAIIAEARKADGNENLTINDVTPDWIRIRGIAYPTEFGWSPNMNFDWGPMFSMY